MGAFVKFGHDTQKQIGGYSVLELIVSCHSDILGQRGFRLGLLSAKRRELVCHEGSASGQL